MNEQRAKVAGLIMMLLAVGGGVDAYLLTVDHQKGQLGEASDICEPGAGCEISRYDRLSEVPLPGRRPGLPISALGLGAYAAILLLAGLRWTRPSEPHTPRLLLGISALATAYSLFLLIYSLSKAGKLCGYCAILYGVNAALFAVSWWSLGEPIKRWLGRVWGSVVSARAAVALGVFAGVVFVAYQLYQAPLMELMNDAMAMMRKEAEKVPSQPKLDVDVSGRPGKGPEDAPIHIVEFADYQCPHCARLYLELDKLMEKRPDEVRVTMMNFPLDKACNPHFEHDFHKKACMLARVGECAHRQGKWAEMAKWLFTEGPRGDQAAALDRAAEVGLDRAALEACVKDSDVDARIAEDVEAGMTIGVKGTPTFLIEGRRVEGGRPVEMLEIMIDALKRDAGAK